jgi:hypothetical protein
MNKLILALFLLISSLANAQIKEVEKSKFIEIGKVGGGMGPFISSLAYLKGDEGTNRYLWLFNNLKYQTITDIKSIDFTATEEEINGLYSMLKKQLDAEKGSEKELELGKSIVKFTTVRAVGVSSLSIWVYQGSVSSYFLVNSKQLDKLFGK